MNGYPAGPAHAPVALERRDMQLEAADGGVAEPGAFGPIRRAEPQHRRVAVPTNYLDNRRTIVVPAPIGRTVPTDADDDMVIATARAAGATLIVTGDADLLVMDPFRGMHVLKSAAALALTRPPAVPGHS